MTIAALPPITYPVNKSIFESQMDAFIPALSTFGNEANALAAAMNLNATTDTSASSVLIGSGTKVFTVSAGKSYYAGQWLTISNTPAPTNQMIGNVTSYSGTTLTVAVPANGVFGSGTLAAWTIALTAAPSAAVSAAMAPVTAAATLPAARTAMNVPSLEYMQIQDQRASGTAGGAAIAGVNNRTLNTVVRNTIAGASVAASVITLPAGTYRINAQCMAVADTAACHVTSQLYNSLVGVVALAGLRSYLANGAATTTDVSGSLTLTGTTTLLLRSQFSAAQAAGLGLAASFGYAEVYANIEIWKE